MWFVGKGFTSSAEDRCGPGGRTVAWILRLKQEDEQEIDEKVWAGAGNWRKLNIPPTEINIDREDGPIWVWQYPISIEGRRGLLPVIRELIEDGTLETCVFPHNTPILPVKKPDGTYRLVQDLREVNKRTLTRYPVVPNPYTLLSKVPHNIGGSVWWTLKTPFGLVLWQKKADIFLRLNGKTQRLEENNN